MLSFRKGITKGFTLVEILIVLALIGLFAAATSYLTHDSRIAQKNAERLADTINTTFRTARSNMVLGKGVLSGSTLVTTDRRVISISPSGITTIYGTTNTGTEITLPYPYFDGDSNYKITDISISSGILTNGQMPIWDQTGVTTVDITISKDGSIQISSLDPSVTTKINAIRITAGYEGFEQSVMLDRIMGRSEVVQGKGETTFIIPPPADSCDSIFPACDGFSCNTVIGTPSSVGQAWVLGSANCGFSCTGGYTGSTCSTPPPSNSCNAVLPSCNGVGCSLIYSPSSVNQSWVLNAGSCGFSCTGGYTGSTCSTPPTGTWTAPTCPSACGNSASNPAYSCVGGNGLCATNSPATLSCGATAACCAPNSGDPCVKNLSGVYSWGSSGISCTTYDGLGVSHGGFVLKSVLCAGYPTGYGSPASWGSAYAYDGPVGYLGTMGYTCNITAYNDGYPISVSSQSYPQGDNCSINVNSTYDCAGICQ